MIAHANLKLFDRKSKDALHNLYSLFVDDNNSIRKEIFKEIHAGIGKEYDDQALQQTLDKLAQYGSDITYEEFLNILF